MKFSVIVALVATSSALTVNKFNFGETAFCKYELNDKGSCAPQGTNPETCRTPENIPNTEYRVPISLWFVEKSHLEDH